MIKSSAFSVLMSLYAKDNPAMAGEALESVLNQTVKPDEIILVVDGAVPEELNAVIEKYSACNKSIKVLRLAENKGLANALKEGLDIVTNPLVARMDSDDISLPNRFELQLSVFAKEKDLDILGGQITEIDAQTKKTLSSRKVPTSHQEIASYMKLRCPFNHMTVMFKKTAVLSAGGYIPLHLMEDYYLWARMLTHGLKMQNLPDVLVLARADDKLFERRGGWKYFKSNKALQDIFLKMGLISLPRYLFNIVIRFAVQVFMPNSIRTLFYKTALRKNG
ncbi:glycosyltransferase involved in cell wall biosynthesis [Elusimicrobium posterum]|uniref:glycosyltransferase n=1 Tax=Elusimicrobium posterum TaxID=3116653 RepID=UPI003C72DEB1